MHVCYTGDIFRNQSRGGISRYFCEIASRIKDFENTEVTINAAIHFNLHLKESIFARAGIFSPISTQRLGINRTINDLARKLEKRYVSAHDFDLIHFTSQSAQNESPNALKVLTVFDLIRETEDKSGARMKLLEASLKRQDAVIAISDSTKKSILENIDIPEKSIKVTWLGISDEFKKRDESVLVTKRKPFILYVGQRGGYKNFEKFCRAFSSDRNLRNEFTLVAAGGGKFSVYENLLFEELGISGRVSQSDASDAQLSILYRSSAMFIFPSLQEGFGIPLIEALSCGTPTACSDIPIFHEISDGAATYFDPFSIESIREKMTELANNYLGGQGSKPNRFNSDNFSWQRCASQTESIYRSIL